MTTSPLGIELIQHFEMCFLKAYQCPAGVWTIGWGTIEYPDKRKVRQGDTCTQVEADAYFQAELAEKEKAVAEMFHELDDAAQLSQPQFDALVSFAYNLGVERLKGSSLRKYILRRESQKLIVGNDGMDYRVFAQNGRFIIWNKVNGFVNKGIVRRRKAEAWLYATGVNRFFEEMLADKTTEPREYV
jgi:lysozyme